MFKTLKEKMAFRLGVMKGEGEKRQPKITKSAGRSTKKVAQPGPKYLGPTCVGGKFYDTNFRKPVEFSPEQVKDLHKEYDVTGKMSDGAVVSSFVRHMRRKYGTFDKAGNFLGLMGED